MKLNTVITSLLILTLSVTLFGAENQKLISDEDRAWKRFEEFKSNPCEDTFNKFEACAKKCYKLKRYADSLKNWKKEKIQVEVIAYDYGEGFANSFGDNKIRIYSKDTQSQKAPIKCILNIGNLHLDRCYDLCELSDQTVKDTDSSWKEEFKKGYVEIFFENMAIWSPNVRSKYFKIDIYEVLAKNENLNICEIQLEDKLKNAWIKLRFFNLPVLEK